MVEIVVHDLQLIQDHRNGSGGIDGQKVAGFNVTFDHKCSGGASGYRKTGARRSELGPNRHLKANESVDMTIPNLNHRYLTVQNFLLSCLHPISLSRPACLTLAEPALCFVGYKRVM